MAGTRLTCAKHVRQRAKTSLLNSWLPVQPAPDTTLTHGRTGPRKKQTPPGTQVLIGSPGAPYWARDSNLVLVADRRTGVQQRRLRVRVRVLALGPAPPRAAHAPDPDPRPIRHLPQLHTPARLAPIAVLAARHRLAAAAEAEQGQPAWAGPHALQRQRHGPAPGGEAPQGGAPQASHARREEAGGQHLAQAGRQCAGHRRGVDALALQVVDVQVGFVDDLLLCAARGAEVVGRATEAED